MHSGGWQDVVVQADASVPGRYVADIAEQWDLMVVPQGGVVAALAAQAMALDLDHADQSLRTLSAVFAGQVAVGPVEIDVTVLRRGRSMSQATATVRNPGAQAGLTAIAVFGQPRPGYAFTDITMPEAPDPEECVSFRDPLPPEAGDMPRREMPFWERIIEGRPAIGHPPWEPYEPITSDRATWYRIDDPPLGPDGRLDPIASIVMCDTMPGAVFEKVGPNQDSWFCPSADFTIHLLGTAEPGWLLAHNRARHAGDGYASVELALWDPTGPTLVAYATQVMFFTAI